MVRQIRPIPERQDHRPTEMENEASDEEAAASSGLPEPRQKLAGKAKNPSAWTEGFFVEPRGIEPLTSSMPWKRSTN